MVLKNIQTQLVIKWEFLKPLQILELFQLYLKTVFKGQNIHFLTVNRNCILSARLGTEIFILVLCVIKNIIDRNLIGLLVSLIAIYCNYKGLTR